MLNNRNNYFSKYIIKGNKLILLSNDRSYMSEMNIYEIFPNGNIALNDKFLSLYKSFGSDFDVLKYGESDKLKFNHNGINYAIRTYSIIKDKSGHSNSVPSRHLIHIAKLIRNNKLIVKAIYATNYTLNIYNAKEKSTPVAFNYTDFSQFLDMYLEIGYHKSYVRSKIETGETIAIVNNESFKKNYPNGKAADEALTDYDLEYQAFQPVITEEGNNFAAATTSGYTVTSPNLDVYIWVKTKAFPPVASVTLQSRKDKQWSDIASTSKFEIVVPKDWRDTGSYLQPYADYVAKYTFDSTTFENGGYNGQDISIYVDIGPYADNLTPDIWHNLHIMLINETIKS